MRDRIAPFLELGKRLKELDEKSRVVAEAVAANPWFMEGEVVAAARIIARTMLEQEPLEKWLEGYPSLPVREPRRVLIVMAGNIPLVGFFDLLCTLLAGHRAVVKPSGKDEVLMHWVVEQLLDIAPSLPVEWYTDQPMDALIATGGDEAVKHFRRHFGAVPKLLRGNRHSVAVLTGEERREELAALAEDLFAYSGLGCRNVSLILAPEGVIPEVPMPTMNPLHRENYRHRRALLTMLSRPFVDWGGALLVEGEEFSEALSEVTLKHYVTPEEATLWLEQHRDRIQCVVGRDYIPFGQAQHPALTDYADGVDTMDFLASI